MKIILTGSTGLLGSNILKLVNYNHEIITLGSSRTASSQVDIPLDLSTSWQTSALPDQNDVIIHLAQSKEFRNFPDKALEIFNTNVASTAALLDYATKSGTSRFILASTGGIYRPGEFVLNEDSELLAPDELSYYYASKLTSELLASTYRKFFDVHILRIFFMYGPNQREDMFIPGLINKVQAGVPIQLNGTNGIKVNPINVQDVARGVVKIVELGGPKSVNVAGSEVYTIKEIAQEIGKILDIDPIYNFLENNKSDLVADHTNFQSLINFKFIPLTQGIKEMIL